MQNRDLKQIPSETTAVLGLRERGKRERLRRIKEAAFEIFRSEGYEGASTRQIAQRADVSSGTLFAYAKDKRDLLFLLMNEDLDAIADRAIASAPSAGSAVDRIVSLLTPIYLYFSRDPDLARTTVHESARLDLRLELGAQAERFHARMQRWQGEITGILRQAELRGTTRAEDEVALLGRAIFSAHLDQVRRWLQQDKPQADAGIRELARLVQVIIGDREKP